MSMQTHFVTPEHDLASLVADINNASWDAGNDLSAYDTAALKVYLEREDTLFVACYDATSNTLLGIASGRLEIKPYGQERWLYVDEVDVCADQRRKGAGKALMRTLIEYAENNGCDELWLGTEVDNVPARSLYSSLAPDSVDTFVGFTFETDE